MRALLVVAALLVAPSLHAQGERFVRNKKGVVVDKAPAKPKTFRPTKKLKGKRIRPKGAFASVVLPQGFSTEDGENELLVFHRAHKGEGAISIRRVVLSREDRGRSVADLLEEAAREEVEGDSVQLTVGPEPLKVGSFRAGRLGMATRVMGNDGLPVTLEAEMYGIVAEDFGYLFIGLWPRDRAATFRPALETLVATFKFHPPQKDKRAMKNVAGCWDHYVGDHGRGDDYTGSSEARYVFENDGRYLYSSSTVASGPGISAISQSEEKGAWFVARGTLFLTSDEGEASSLAVKKKGGLLLLGGDKYVPCH